MDLIQVKKVKIKKTENKIDKLYLLKYRNQIIKKLIQEKIFTSNSVQIIKNTEFNKAINFLLK